MTSMFRSSRFSPSRTLRAVKAHDPQRRAHAQQKRHRQQYAAHAARCAAEHHAQHHRHGMQPGGVAHELRREHAALELLHHDHHAQRPQGARQSARQGEQRHQHPA